jgi:hypothetical protein
VLRWIGDRLTWTIPLPCPSELNSHSEESELPGEILHSNSWTLEMLLETDNILDTDFVCHKLLGLKYNITCAQTTEVQRIHEEFGELFEDVILKGEK